MNVTQEISRLQLPKHSFMVVGSGILGALHMRESDDIDLIVTPRVFERLVHLGWKQVTEEGGLILKHYPFDVGLYWEKKDLAFWLPRATMIDDVPYLSLTDLRRWKKEHARPKDPIDLKLIDDYLRTHPDAR